MGFKGHGSKGIYGTTVIGLSHKGEVVVGADGQATMGDCVAKQRVTKVRTFQEGKVVVGFAGATADAFTLLERLDEKLSNYSGSLPRAVIELAKDWRTDRYLRRLEAMLITASKDDLFVVTGSGDVIESEEGVVAIGSGGMYALAAARALKGNAKHMGAKEMVEQSLLITADICIYTNKHLLIERVAV